MRKFVSGGGDRYWNPGAISLIKDPSRLEDGTFEVEFWIVGVNEPQHELFDDEEDADRFVRMIGGFEAR